MNIAGFDLNLLTSLEAVLEERSVTRAAKRVGLSQPAMSHALGRLRRIFDDPLLIRNRGRMVLTPRAQQLARPVREALDKVRGVLQDRERFVPAQSTRTFTIATSDYFELVLAPGLLARIAREAPNIALRFIRVESLFTLPQTELAEGRCDVALGFFMDQPPPTLPLIRQELGEVRNVCIAAAGHPRLKRGKITSAQFAAERHAAIFYQREGPGLIDRQLASQGLERKVALALPHFTTICQAVAASDLIATVPEPLAAYYAEAMRLRSMPVPFAMAPFVNTLVWHERTHTDPGVAWLRGVLPGVVT